MSDTVPSAGIDVATAAEADAGAGAGAGADSAAMRSGTAPEALEVSIRSPTVLPVVVRLRLEPPQL
jgi:hypothetical protein